MYFVIDYRDPICNRRCLKIYRALQSKIRYLMQRARTVIGLFGVTLNLTISKIVYRQNSLTLNKNCKFWSPISDSFKGLGTYHRPRTQSTGPVELSLQDKWTLMTQKFNIRSLPTLISITEKKKSVKESAFLVVRYKKI